MPDTLLFTDDFHRSNRALDGDNGWTDPAGSGVEWNISSNTAVSSSNASGLPSYPLLQLASPVCRADAFSPTWSGSHFPIAVMYDAAKTHSIAAYFDGSHINLTVGGGDFGHANVTDPGVPFYVSIRRDAGSSSGVKYTANMYKTSDDSLLGTWSYDNDTTAAYQLSNDFFGGIAHYGSQTYTKFQSYVPSSSLVATALTEVVHTDTSASMTRGTSSGGTGPYTYQIKRSTTSGSGYANVSGGTGAALREEGLTANTDYYYVVETTDSASATALSAELHIHTDTLPKPIRVNVVSDSIPIAPNGPGSQNAVYFMRDMLKKIGGIRDVAVVASGVNGTTTVNFLPGTGADWPQAVEIGSQVHANIWIVALGQNDAALDARSASDYGTNMLAIAAGAFALTAPNTAPDHIIFPHPIWCGVSGTETILATYRTQINSIVNGATILKGDTFSVTWYSGNPGELQDLIHPGVYGVLSLAELWTFDIWNKFINTGGGGGGGMIVISRGMTGGM